MNGCTDLDSNSAANWAAKIRLAWTRGHADTLELARIVFSTRCSLDDGQWTALIKSGGLPFGRRKAQMLSAVGEGLGWAGAQTFAQLPRGWSVLYYLSKLPRHRVEEFISDSTIHPALTLHKAKELSAPFRGHQAVARKPNLMQRLKIFSDFARAHLIEWSMEERDQARAGLLQLSEELGGVDMIHQDADECSNGSKNTPSNTPMP
jgi:hypothetical protein